MIIFFKNPKLLKLMVTSFLFISTLVFAHIILADTTGDILPSGDGNYTAWTPSSGATHYTMVDEATCNGKTDYNYTDTTGDRDSYVASLSSVSNGSTITAIEITPCASRNKNGGGPGASAVLDVFYRFDGNDSADSGNYALTGTNPQNLTATTFSGLSLVKGASSSLEAGAVYTSGNKGARLSRVAVKITYTPLAAPTNLGATAVSQSQINLVWTDNAGNEDGFKIERRNDSASGTFAQIDTVTVDEESYNDIGLDANTTYSYRVRAYNTGGDSGYSNIDSDTTFLSIPEAPTNLAANYYSSSTYEWISLNWDDNSDNETGFKIERGTDGENFEQIDTVGANYRWYDDWTVESGNTYYYRVRAYNGSGNSDYSNTVQESVP